MSYKNYIQKEQQRWVQAAQSLYVFPQYTSLIQHSTWPKLPFLPWTSSEVFPHMLSLLIPLKIHSRERWECKHPCVQCDLRLLQMNVNINFNLPVIIPSSVPRKKKNHLPIALSKQRSVWESRQTKVTSLCVILHSVREEDAETIQPTGHHGLIQQSFISPLD